MRVLLIVLGVLVGLLAAGWFLVRLVLAHLPGLVGFLGVVLLIVASFVRSRPKCEGFHCSGCKSHH
jgi:hypothetical protein